MDAKLFTQLKPYSSFINQTSKSFSNTEMAHNSVQLALPSHLRPQPQQRINSLSAAVRNARRLTPNLPHRNLIAGPREAYLDVGIPLYEACIRCNWKGAAAILHRRPELVRFSITDNGETPLHVAASAKGDPKKVEGFVKKLVDSMTEEDLELENEDFNTALYLASAAGNFRTVKIMVERRRDLVTIPGGRRQLMPLSAAAMNGYYDVVKYLYEKSNDLQDVDGWTKISRSWLLDKCVEADMFDVALQIVKCHPLLGSGNILGVLARKPYAFSETKSNIIKRSINSIFALVGFGSRAYEKESEALQLLKIVWEHIAKKPRDEIDRILRGAPDSTMKDENLTSENVIQTLQLQSLISKHLHKLEVETQNIMGGLPVAVDQQALQLQNVISEHLVSMHVATQNLIKQDNTKPVSGKEDQVVRLQKLISKHIVSMHATTQNIIKRESRKKDQVLYLHKLISRSTDLRRMDPTLNFQEPYSSRILFVAAEMGNTYFLVELIRRYPDLIWKVNNTNQTIFHIAVKERHESIYNLLYEIGSMKDMITPKRDADGNNMLHLAGKRATTERLANVSGAALQMKIELLWFEEVRNMMPPSYREQKNKDGLTPRQVFTEEHKELVTEAGKWMKETASQCMVVAALIATIVFAAAFTVPGGYDQNDGMPIFNRKPIFVVFVVADAISLIFSSTSILTFLSILTSRYAERDFLTSLPLKLMIGFTSLFLSIATMMITFSASFFILYHKEKIWVPILIGVFSIVPAVHYVVFQYHLLVDVFHSSYGSRYLFKPERQILFYANPRV